MPRRKTTTAPAILAATAGAGAFAATAPAAVVDNDGVTVNGANVDVTGNLAYDRHDGTMTPGITGTLGITGAQFTRGRVRIDHDDGNTLLGTEYGNAMAPPRTSSRSGASTAVASRARSPTRWSSGPSWRTRRTSSCSRAP